MKEKKTDLKQIILAVVIICIPIALCAVILRFNLVVLLLSIILMPIIIVIIPSLKTKNIEGLLGKYYITKQELWFLLVILCIVATVNTKIYLISNVTEEGKFHNQVINDLSTDFEMSEEIKDNLDILLAVSPIEFKQTLTLGFLLVDDCDILANNLSNINESELFYNLPEYSGSDKFILCLQDFQDLFHNTIKPYLEIVESKDKELLSDEEIKQLEILKSSYEDSWYSSIEPKLKNMLSEQNKIEVVISIFIEASINLWLLAETSMLLSRFIGVCILMYRAKRVGII